MFFLLAIWDFIFMLGLFYTFLIFWIAFHRYTTFERFGGPKKDQVFWSPIRTLFLRPLSPDLPHQLNIFGHYCYPLCMHCAKVGVLKEAYQACLRGLL